MESFEQFVAVALEAEGLVVSEAVKFPVTRQTSRTSYVEVQTHGYEVDLVGARSDRLVLATVKSFLGSRGVVAEHVMGSSTSDRSNRLYALLNDPIVRDGVRRGAAKRYGYSLRQIELRLYVGRFAAPTTGTHERAIRERCRTQRCGGGIKVFNLDDVVTTVRRAATGRTYRDNPVIVMMRVLEAAGLLERMEER